MDVLKKLFEQHFHAPPELVVPLQGQLGGSGRKIIRLSNEKSSAIGILYDVREENVAFLEFSRHFRRHGLPVPEIYAEELSAGAYLEEDFGDTTLFEFLSRNRSGAGIAPAAVDAYRKAVEVLPRFQVGAGSDLDYSVCYPIASFDRQSIAWDLNYFKYYFLRLAGIPFSERALENDFGRLTDFLLNAPCDYFLYRDFQSRNIMLRDGQPFFLDYQGGRKGALQYDIASLLYDAKADLPPELRQCSESGNAGSASPQGHYGLSGIYERVASIGGHLSLGSEDSSTSHGTTIEVELPLVEAPLRMSLLQGR